MKIILTLLMILSFLNANEMKRIEAIVSDIQKLRADYNKCEKKLQNKGILVSADSKDLNKYEKLYTKEMQENTILKAKLSFKNDLLESNKLLSKKIEKLEKKLLTKNNLLKTKDKTINKLSKNTKNTFPKLMMKKEFEEKIDKIDPLEKFVTFKASSFHLVHESVIYDAINGKKLDIWVKNTSFTSSIKTASWIKITGYFVNKKWKSAKYEMWVKIAQVEKK